jgi:hypothetical protein
LFLRYDLCPSASIPCIESASLARLSRYFKPQVGIERLERREPQPHPSHPLDKKHSEPPLRDRCYAKLIKFELSFHARQSTYGGNEGLERQELSSCVSNPDSVIRSLLHPSTCELHSVDRFRFSRSTTEILTRQHHAAFHLHSLHARGRISTRASRTELCLFQHLQSWHIC